MVFQILSWDRLLNHLTDKTSEDLCVSVYDCYVAYQKLRKSSFYLKKLSDEKPAFDAKYLKQLLPYLLFEKVQVEL